MVSEGPTDTFEENPLVATTIVEKAAEALRAREAARKARDLTRRKNCPGSGAFARQAGRLLAQRPGRMRDIYRRGRIGRRAGQAGPGTGNIQAILPLKGKILNVERARLDKILGNIEIRTLILALGTGMGDVFDIGKARYGKVIIMTDADMDGSHIRTLSLTFFYRYMKPLIEAGNVFIAQPPLYQVKKARPSHYAFTRTSDA